MCSMLPKYIHALRPRCACVSTARSAWPPGKKSAIGGGEWKVGGQKDGKKKKKNQRKRKKKKKGKRRKEG